MSKAVYQAESTMFFQGALTDALAKAALAIVADDGLWA